MLVKSKKFMSIVLSTLIVLSVILIIPIQASALRQNDIVSWFNSKNGTTITEYGYSQCVAAFNSYLRLWGISNPISKYPVDYAYQIFNYNAPDGWQKISGSGNYQVGDVVVWNSSVGNGCGHVGMVYSTDGGTIKIFDQNYVQKNVCGIHVIAQTSAIRGVFRPPLSNELDNPIVNGLFYHGADDYSNFRPVIKFSNPETVEAVNFALKYEGNDWHWYGGVFNGDNAWFCDVLSNDLGNGEEIVCHCYVSGKNGSYIGYVFSPDPKVEELFYHGSTDHSDFRPVARITNPDSVSEVKFAVKYDGGDWHWYDGIFNGSNTWYCDVLSSDLGTGVTIFCHCYVYGKNGHTRGCVLPELSLEKDKNPEAISWYYDGATDNSDFRPVIRISNPETVSYVMFAVRYDTTDWKWYGGVFNGGNAWFCDVLSSDLGTGHSIFCHAYVYANNGSYKGYPLEELRLDKDNYNTTEPTEPTPSESQPNESTETQPVTDKPTEPTETQPVTDKPTEPTETQPVTDKPTEPTETQPVTDKPTEPMETEPVTDKPKEPTDPTETEPVTDKPTEPTETQPVTDKPTEPTETQPVTDKPTEPTETQPVTDKPTEPMETEPVTDKPTEPTETQPVTDKPTEPTETEPAKTDISKWNVSGIKNKTYTGRVIKQDNIIVSKDGEYADFSVKYKNNLNVGTATVTITGTGDYTGTIVKTFKITKAANPVKVTAKPTVTTNSKKKTTIKKAVTVKNPQGDVTYTTNNKKVTVKNGTMTVAKGLKKGKTISVKVTVTAKGNSNYKSKKIEKTIKIKVK